jgi:hypothetical protein
MFAGSVDQVLVSDFFPVWSPSMRKDGIFRNTIPASLNQAELTTVVELEKTHFYKELMMFMIETASQAIEVGMRAAREAH